MKDVDNIGIRFPKNGNRIKQSLIWDDIRVFLAVCRAGTITGAAEFLGVGIATISRKIERIEAFFGMPLFLRHQAGYRLTEDGAELLEKAKCMEDAANSLLVEADMHSEISGKVRIATTEILANNLIIPNLINFHRNYPDLALELISDIHTVNLHRRDADLALRIIRPERGHVTVRQLGILGFGLYGSADYLATTSFGGDRDKYENYFFIGWTDEQSQLPAFKWIEQKLKGRPLSIATTSLSAQISAVKAGLGLAVLPHFVANEEGFISVSSELGIDQPIWLVIQADLAHSPRIRKVADFLSDIVFLNRDNLLGVR
ncbi:LysR family transcriptional regulator [Xenorhabdus sp. Vera]|uniref:LysR family transcriptional regulator n=1 Tax=Xenorhabdus koppenhoeferi TaxID=351659 RepID=UPI0019A8D633|nr:LysR family transcriptional regulator [Xenorhabdus sp. Vera]MBD2810150.1 LysR family transcriptional regulator [Xenorhabdus sp. Vera]